MEPDEWQPIRKRYASFLAVAGYKPSTIRQRLTNADRFASWHRGDLRTATTDELLGYFDNPLWRSPNSRRTFHNAIAFFFAWALSVGLVDTDPTVDIPKAKTRPSETVPATQEAIRAGMKNAEGRERLMIKLAYVAGMKPVEIALAHSSHLFRDAQGNKIRAYRGSAFREVSIPAPLADELSAFNGYIFPGRIDGHISPPYVSKLFPQVMPNGETAEQVRLASKRAQERSVTADNWRDVASFHTTKNLKLLALPELDTSENLQRHLDLISRDLDTDPASAIDSCKNLLESLFKLVIADKGGTPDESTELPALFKQVSEALGINAQLVPGNARASEALKLALNGSITTVRSIAEMRNRLGDGHGTHDRAPAQPIHARLAFNAAVTVSEFIVDTWRPEDAE